jgi:hypothetical protein
MAVQKIVILSESINVNDSSCSKCNVALIQNLKQCGYDVKVYHFTRQNIKLANIKCIEIKEIKYSFLYILSRLQRIIFRLFNLELHVFLENIFGFSFTFYNDVNSIKKIIRNIKNDNPDLIFTLSKGTSFRPHYAMMSFPELYSKWVANIHDPFPFHFNPRPYNWVEPGYQQKEDFFLKLSENAKYSTFPSLLLKEWMGSYFPNFLKTGFVIPHQNANQDIPKTNLPEYFEKGKFTILHAGNMLKQRSPVGLIQGFMLFLQQNPEAENNSKLLLIGPSEYHKETLKKYDNQVNQLLVYDGSVDFDIVYNLQKEVNVNVILESKAEISPFLPGKFPHCVEANKTIISLSPYYSETKRLLGADYPYWSEIDDVDKIASMFTELYKLWKINPELLQINNPKLLDY